MWLDGSNEGCGVLVQVLSVVGILQDEADPMVSVMKASLPLFPPLPLVNFVLVEALPDKGNIPIGSLS